MNWFKKIIRSVFTKLLLVIILTGICVNIVVGGFFWHHRRLLVTCPCLTTDAQACVPSNGTKSRTNQNRLFSRQLESPLYKTKTSQEFNNII